MEVRIIKYDKAKKQLSLSMKAYSEADHQNQSGGDEPGAGTYMDPAIEGAKTTFQLAYERAQALQTAGRK